MNNFLWCNFHRLQKSHLIKKSRHNIIMYISQRRRRRRRYYLRVISEVLLSFEDGEKSFENFPSFRTHQRLSHLNILKWNAEQEEDGRWEMMKNFSSDKSEIINHFPTIYLMPSLFEGEWERRKKSWSDFSCQCLLNVMGMTWNKFHHHPSGVLRHSRTLDRIKYLYIF